MTLNLTIKERLILPALFPERADKLTQMICEGIERKASFSPEEIERYGITVVDNGWKWNDQYDAETCAVKVTDAEASVLKEQSKHLDREHAVTRPILSLIRKIDEM
jgi:hypothetical protein